MDDEKIALQAEVANLQLKLHQLHATDVNTYRRSYATIAQHVEALKVEASRLEALVQEVEPDIYTPDFVAEEFGKAAAMGGAGWVLYKIVRSIPPIPPKAKSWLGRGLFVATAVVISLRFASSSIGRFASAFLHHRRRKKAFLKELAELQHRIDILQAITASLPHALSQPSLTGPPGAISSAAVAVTATGGGGAAAAAEAAAGAGAARASSGPSSRSGSGGNGGREQFIVLDLPRVESDGFVLPSPVPSPPPAVLVSGLPPVPPAGGVTGSVAGDGSSGGAGASSSGGARGRIAGHVTSGAGTGPFAAAAAAAGSGDLRRPVVHKPAAVPGPPAAAAAGAGASQPHQLLQEQGQEETGVDEPAASMGAVGSRIPDAVMNAGWGGVTQQQQQPWQPPSPPANQQQQQQALAGGQGGMSSGGAASPTPQPAARQGSSGALGEEGELVEQVSDPEDATTSSRHVAAGQLLAGSTGAAGADKKPSSSQGLLPGGLQRGSPASSSSEDAVLLERE